MKTDSGQKGKKLFQPLRAALTGRVHGPDLDRTVALVVDGAARAPGRITGLAERVAATQAWLA